MSKPMESDAASLVVELRERQRQSWSRGERLLVETMLDSHPALRKEEDCITELLYAEYLLREQMEGAPNPQEYFGRFPAYESRLQRLFEVHRALECEPAGADGQQTFDAALDSGVASCCVDESRHGQNAALWSRDPIFEPQVEAGLGRFGDYELLEEIARGGMGIVYRARHLPADRIVALKMILAGQFAADTEIEHFCGEAQAAANLDHPGIVPIHDVGRLNGRDYFSMGYVEGSSLAERTAAGPIPPREAAELMRDVSRAIHYAHQRGIVHRDLKPANVLIDNAGNPKITDFGLAKRLHAVGPTITGDVIGTPSYMSPEQAIADTEQIGPTCDIYSLGAVLYCLLTGKPPFQAATAVDTLAQVVGQDPVSPKRMNAAIDYDLETICLKCLEKEPQRRYASAADVAAELERYLAREPIAARPISRADRVWRWCRRRSLVAGLTATAIGLALTIVALLVVGYVHENRLRQDADTARQLADENAQQARQQSLLALQTLEAVIFEIQRKLQNVPASHEARREMLNSVLDRLDHVADTLETRPRADHHRAVVHVELGELILRVVQVENGATGRALRQFQQANDIFRQLATADPNDSLVLTNLAVSHGKLAEAHRQLGNLNAALTEQQRGLDLLERLLQLKPKNVSITERLADAHSHLGKLHFALSDLKAAEKAHQQSLRMFMGLAAEQPEATQYQRQLSVNRAGLAAIAMRQGRLEESHEALEDCLRTRRELTGFEIKTPTNIQDICDLSSILRQLGDLYLQQLNVSQAREHFQQSLLVARQAAEVDGNNAQVKRCLERALAKVGEMALRSGTAAQRHLEEALALQQQRVNAHEEDFGAAVELACVELDLAQSHQQLGNLVVARDMYLAAVQKYEQ